MPREIELPAGLAGGFRDAGDYGSVVVASLRN
jgi:hypothetical protein